MMTHEDFQRILDRVRYKHNWRIVVRELDAGTGRLYLQVQFQAPCAVTGRNEVQSGRKWLLSRHMTEGEVLQTALKAVITAEEHEARENFKVDGEAVFGPHLDVDALLGLPTVERH